MIVAILRAHGGKMPDTDSGSVFDADGDGKIAFDEREDFLAGLMSQAMESALRVLGHEVFVFGAGDYSQRTAEMRELLKGDRAPHVILHPHLDVRPWSNPLFLYDEKSENGPLLAELVAREVFAAFPDLGRPKCVAATKTSSPGGERICKLHRTDRGVALVMETFTTALAADWANRGMHTKLLDAGVAAARGIHAWAVRKGLAK